MSSNVRVHLIIGGRVQGVGFRYFTLELANKFGIVGWVRNTYRDEVEIVAEGEKEVLENWLQLVKIGPAHSKVINVKIDWSEATGEFSRFSIAHNF
jgi:acylphosphatase